MSSSSQKCVLIILSILCYSQAEAQEREKQFKELFPVGLKLSPSAFHIGVGATKLWGPFGGESDLFYTAGDSSYSSKISGKGEFGLVLEAGYTRLYKSNSFADQLDVTVGFKQFKGSQEHRGTLVYEKANEELVHLDVSGEGYFDNTYLTLSTNVYKHLQINTTKYFLVGYGLNVDYRMFNTTSYTRDFGLQRNQFPDKLRAQAHLRWGYGFFYRKLVLINTFLEVPVVGTDGIGATKWFSTPYVPMLFTIRITWLKTPNSLKCPPIRPGSGEKAKKKDYLQELFHPDSRRHPAPPSEETQSD